MKQLKFAVRRGIALPVNFVNSLIIIIIKMEMKYNMVPHSGIG